MFRYCPESFRGHFAIERGTFDPPTAITPDRNLTFFRQRTKNQISQPVRMGDAVPVGVERFDRRIDAQVAERLIRILPALVPIDCCFEARIARPKEIESFLDPGALVTRTRELARRP